MKVNKKQNTTLLPQDELKYFKKFHFRDSNFARAAG
jgi:hypothetical protein